MTQPQPAPDFLRQPIQRQKYDASQDLLTAGLGRSGLTLPGPDTDILKFKDPSAPALWELRRNSIVNSHIGLIDRSPASGYGTKYGPGVIDEQIVDDGKVSGYEYIGFADTDDGDPDTVVTMLVQIPDTFNKAEPMLVAAVPSASRTVYGAVSVVGEWALQHGCAVVYTDKGLGVGFHDLDRNKAFGITGQCLDADDPNVNFKAELPEEYWWRNRYPYRFACKHAHSRRNPERSWGQDVRRAIRFAFYVLNEHFKDHPEIPNFARDNTKVIAAGISNGGAAALLAAEADTWDGENLIDAVVAGEPTIQPNDNIPFAIVDGGETVKVTNKSLLDYLSVVNLYQSCVVPTGKPRLNALKTLGLLAGGDPQKVINDYGILPAQNWLAPLYQALEVPLCVCVTYANAYGRFDVKDNLCNYSFAAVDQGLDPLGRPRPLPSELPYGAMPDITTLPNKGLVTLYAVGNGLPPNGGIKVINNRKNMQDFYSSPDQNLDGALSLRRVVTGGSEGAKDISFEEKTLEHGWHWRVRAGIREVRATANLHGKPVIMFQGRLDALVAPNHCGRAYFARNQIVENVRSNLRYYEVSNAHHFDTLNSHPLWTSLFPQLKQCISLHIYLLRALNLLHDYVRNRVKSLPPSQVIHAINNGGALELPEIDPTPASSRKIDFEGGTLTIPPEPPFSVAREPLVTGEIDEETLCSVMAVG